MEVCALQVLLFKNYKNVQISITYKNMLNVKYLGFRLIISPFLHMCHIVEMGKKEQISWELISWDTLTVIDRIRIGQNLKHCGQNLKSMHNLDLNALSFHQQGLKFCQQNYQIPPNQ